MKKQFNAYNPDTSREQAAYQAMHAQELAGTGFARVDGVPVNTQRAWEQQQYQQTAAAAKAGQRAMQGDMTVKTISRPTPNIIRAPKKGR